MTTNIKLFENWLAEEGEAVETPPAVDTTAATTTMTTVKPAVAAKAVPIKFEANGQISKKVAVKAVINSPVTPFDITKSNLTVYFSGEIPNMNGINANYSVNTTKPSRFQLDRPSQDNYDVALKIAQDCRNDSGAKRSLSAILYEVLGLAGVTDRTKQDSLLSTDSSKNMYNIMIATGLTSYRGGKLTSVSTSPTVFFYLKSLTIWAQVNVDTLQLTGKYAYNFSYRKVTDSSAATDRTSNSNMENPTATSNIVSVQPTADPSSLIVDDIFKEIGLNSTIKSASPFMTDLLSIITKIMPSIQANAQKPVA